jgi:hypothetical protein
MPRRRKKAFTIPLNEKTSGGFANGHWFSLLRKRNAEHCSALRTTSLSANELALTVKSGKLNVWLSLLVSPQIFWFGA